MYHPISLTSTTLPFRAVLRACSRRWANAPVGAALVLLLAPGLAFGDFGGEQKRFPRVKQAFERREASLRDHFAKAGLPYPPEKIFIRVLKREEELELWAQDRAGSFALARTYPICYASGRLGPKRREGDLQVPEGFYYIERFNPSSNYHLSLGVSYPNASDRILGHKGKLGGDIFIHGNCVSIGCVAITDEKIEEVYALAVMARAQGQNRIPVHIFPGRMDAGEIARLERGAAKEMVEFWRNLAVGYRWFEEKKTLPRVSVDAEGRYLFAPQ